MSELYEKCPACKVWQSASCERCHDVRFLKVGITKDDVTRLHDHLGRDAAMMAELRTEVTRLEGLLKEAREAIDRRDRQLAEATVRLEATGRTAGELALRLGIDAEQLAEILTEKWHLVVAEYQAEADAGRD